MPNVDLSKAAAELNHAVKEGAYVAVGLGVLGFQRAQVQRVELTKQVEAQLTALNSQLEGYLGTVRDQAEARRGQFTEQLSDIGKTVEEILAPAVSQLSKAVQTELPQLAKVVDERVAPARQQFNTQLDRFEEHLSAGPRRVVHSVRTVASTQEQALRSAVGLS
jgi:hypothetical protein